MSKAEEVRNKRLIAVRHRELYNEIVQKVDKRIQKIFDVILDVIQKNTEEYILTDILIFCEKTFDVKEFAMVRGLQSLAKTGTYKENVIYHDCEGFSIEYKGTGGLDDIYEYIYQFIKEKRNEDNQLIK